MKKILLTVLSIASVATLSAQKVNRMVLLEEGTNASCGPCASQNPAFNANIIQPNWNTKVLAVKYQWYFPGFDPMHNDNPDEASARLSYYGINGVPTAAMNGIVPDNNNTSGGNWTGYAGGPYGFTTTVINNAYDELTPFELTVSHTLSEDLDSAYLTVNINNVDTDTFNGGNMKLRIAMIEKTIEYASAPGSNGESVFEEVMRKMLPNQNGTNIEADWLPGTDSTINIEAVIPSYIRRFDQIAFIAWIQDDSDKEVYQSAYSEPVPVEGLDVAISTNANPSDYCQITFDPVITINNLSDEAVTAVNFEVSLNGGAPVTESFSGSIPANGSTSHTLNTVNLSEGEVNTIDVLVVSVNGGVDINKANNELVVEQTVVSSGEEAPIEDDFEGVDPQDDPEKFHIDETNGSFPYVVANSVFQGVTEDLGGFGESDQSLFFPLGYSSVPVGTAFSVISDNYDLSGFEDAELQFSFSYGSLTNNDNSEITVDVSTDCGQSWDNIYEEDGEDINNSGVDAQRLIFPDDDEWNKVKLDMTEFIGEAEVMVRFRIVKDACNTFYIDDVTMKNTPLSVNEIAASEVVLYPNPATDIVNIENAGTNANIEIMDMNGRTVLVDRVAQNGINVSALPAGVYNVIISSDESTVNTRLTIVK